MPYSILLLLKQLMLLVVHDDDFDDTFRRFPTNRKFQPTIEQHAQRIYPTPSTSPSQWAIDSRSVLQGVVQVVLSSNA